MKIKKLRHVGLPCKSINEVKKYLELAGFIEAEMGSDNILGQKIDWVKMDNGKGMVIELLDGWLVHLAFEVDEVNKQQYYIQAPSGAKIQWARAPMPIEFVEVP